VEDHRSWLERPTTRICDLLLRLLPGRAWLADHLNEAAEQLKVELAAQREVEAELKALRCPTAWVWDLVLGGANGLSSLATFMYVVAELLGNWINAVVVNEVRWGSHSTLVAVMLHFPELDTDLVVLGFGRTAGLTDDAVDALWSHMRVAAHTLASHVPSLVTHNPLDDVVE
jgi:hypothetical protein